MKAPFCHFEPGSTIVILDLEGVLYTLAQNLPLNSSWDLTLLCNGMFVTLQVMYSVFYLLTDKQTYCPI